MELFTFRIVGLSPLLQHNPASMGAGSGDSLKGKKKYVASEDAEASVYRNADGQIVHPSIAFRAAMFRACTGRKIGKMSAKTVVAASVFPVESECLLIDPVTEKPLTKYEINAARVVVQRNAVIRHRAMFPKWATDFVVEIDTEMLPKIEVVEELLNIAGKIAGIGDWRVEKLGTFGRFSAKLK
jgi:hypothetical protein